MKEKKNSFFRDYTQAGLATCGAVTFTNPLEVVKTRLQLQGELVRRGQYVTHYNGVFHATRLIFQQEGLLALQKGLLSAYYYQLAMNGTRLGLFDLLKRTTNQTFLKDYPTLVNVGCGAFAGVVGAFVGSPFFLVKTRLQSSGGLVGHQHQITGLTQGLLSVFRSEGITGLWRGASAAMLRTMIGSACQLTTYEYFKVKISEQNLFPSPSYVHGVASMFSGFFVATAMNPFDVVSTRLYNQNSKAPLYKGPIDCLSKIFMKEGIWGFFKGFAAHYFRIGPHTVLTLTFWEQVKSFTAKYIDGE